jgi:hypothetical protein
MNTNEQYKEMLSLPGLSSITVVTNANLLRRKRI